MAYLIIVAVVKKTVVAVVGVRTCKKNAWCRVVKIMSLQNAVDNA
jgi:hypothetical protein